MEVIEKIRRHGTHLVRLAIAALIVATLYLAWLAYVPWLPTALQDPSILARYYSVLVAEPEALPTSIKLMFSLSGIAIGISILLPLWMLYRLGDRLRRDNALTPDTATAVRHLAHSIIASQVLLPFLAGILVGVAGSALSHAGGDMQLASSAFSSGGVVLKGLGEVFLLIVTCLCLYSLAWLIQVGAEAADDARSIV